MNIDLTTDGEYEVEHENFLARVRVVFTGEHHSEISTPTIDPHPPTEDEYEEMVRKNITTGKRSPINQYPIYAVGVKWLPKFQAIRTEQSGEVPVLRPLIESYVLLGLSHDDAELTKLVKKGEYLAHEITDPKDYKGVIM